ncbi:MAG: hypothetical protein GXO64_03220 [Candidatus Micrarchaeota archaeon]|nr:hypothetical protein [Candidatus Micrarchaeota archaeon]
MGSTEDFQLIKNIDIAKLDEKPTVVIVPKGEMKLMRTVEDELPDEPIERVEELVRKGYRSFEFVDKSKLFGIGNNDGIIKEIAKRFQDREFIIGGGIKDLKDVEKVMGYSPNDNIYPLIGSAATDRYLESKQRFSSFIQYCIRASDGRLIVSVDDAIGPDGKRTIRRQYTTRTPLLTDEYIRALAGVGVFNIKYTGVSAAARGGERGPDIEGLKALPEKERFNKIIYAGGVTLDSLLELYKNGANGAIFGSGVPIMTTAQKARRYLSRRRRVTC